MAKLDKTFPTGRLFELHPRAQDGRRGPARETSPCTPTPKWSPISGYVGNFQVQVKRRPPTWTGPCARAAAPARKNATSKKNPDKFNEKESGRPPRSTSPFPQAIPKKAVIDPTTCRQFVKGKCGVCAKVCPDRGHQVRHGRRDRDRGRGRHRGRHRLRPHRHRRDRRIRRRPLPGRHHRTAVRASAVGPPARPAATSSARPTARSRRTSSSSSAWARATSRWDGRTARASAACTRPSRPS